MSVPSQHDSLVLGGEIELWGGPGGTVSVNPMCPGAVFQVMPGYDLSAPQPTTDFVASLVTDGERPFGRRASDRTPVLPVKITAPDWSTLAGARELLLQLIDQPFWTLTWTRRASPQDTMAFPLVLDCFRAKPSVVGYGGLDKAELQPVQLITISFEALPYGRADTAQQIAFAAPVPAVNAPAAPPAPVVLDSFATINNPQCAQSSVHVIGPTTCFWDPGVAPAFVPDGTGQVLTYGTTFSSALNLTGLTGITFYLGLGSRYYFNCDRGHLTITVTMTLTDSDGTPLSFTVRQRIPVSQDPANPAFTLVSMAIPQSAAAFNYGAVSSYQMTLRNRAPRFGFQSGELRWTCVYLDALTAVPPSSIPVAPSVRGSIYNLAGIQGTVHTLAALSFQQAPTPGTPTTVTVTGAGNYTVPANTVYLKVEAVGGGGAGGTAGWGAYALSGGGVTGGQQYMTLTSAQAATVTAGDTFKFTAGPNSGATVYTVTAVGVPAGGFSQVNFTPSSGSTPSSSDTITCQSAVRGGGGGAAYSAEPLFPATPAQVIPYVVGTGGTSGASPVNGAQTVFGPAAGPLVIANGGQSATEGSLAGGAGGLVSSNTITYPGGAGRTTVAGTVGGGGGGSGGSASPGNVPTGTAATVFTAAGPGTWTCPAGVTQVYVEVWGAGASGGTGSSFTNGAGGGGGEYSAAYVNVTPLTVYNYTVGTGGTSVAGSGLTGHNGTSSVFTGDAGVTVTGHGGTGGQSTGSGGGGNGGSGSSSTVEWQGGAGGGASPYSGGGGSSAGPTAAGNAGNGFGTPGTAPTGGGNGGAGSGANNNTGTAGSAPGGGGGGTYSTAASGAGAAGQVRLTYPGGAPSNNGAAAVTGGGAGGAGGGTGNTAGTAGSQPGGGGGGGNSAGTTEAGGAGGAGRLVITPYTPPTFKTLIAHRPSAACPIELNPLVAIGGAVPGSTEFPVQSLVTGRNARFDNTYSIVLVAQTWNSPSSPRTISVTVKQYEYTGGASYTVTTTPVIVTPSTQVTNGIVYAGTLTLPYKAVPKDNTTAYFTAIVTDSNASDTFYDILLLDTQGQTVIINEPSSGYVTYYIDAPDPVYDIGLHLGSQAGRPSAVSVSDAIRISGGPLTLEPGRNTLLCYCVEGAPAISVSYYPAYYTDRLWLPAAPKQAADHVAAPP